MSSALRSSGIVAMGLIVSMAALGCMAHGPTEQLPTATVVAPPGTSTYHLRDMHGRMITATVPALGSPAVKVSDPVQRTVPVTVLAIDKQRSEAKVQTQKGQLLVLTLPPASLASMRTGDHFLLQVVHRSAA